MSVPREKEASFSFLLLSSTRLRAQLQAFITLAHGLSVRSNAHLDLSSSRAKKKKKVSTFVARALFSPRRKNTRSRRAIQNSNDSKFKLQGDKNKKQNLPNNRCACARAQELPPPLAVALIFETYFARCCVCLKVCVCVCVWLKKGGFCCCVLFSLFCFFLAWREKRSRGCSKFSLPGRIRFVFALKNPRKNVSNQSSLHVTFLLLNRRARSNAPFEHAQKHTHKKRSRETLDCLRFKTVSSEVTARSPFKKRKRERG